MVSLLEQFKCVRVSKLVVNLQLNLPLEHKEKLRARLTLTDDLSALLKEGLLHVILDLVIEFSIKIFFQILFIEVIDMLQKCNLE